MQQLYEDQPSLNQIEVLNTFCKEGRESLLSLNLKKVLAADLVNKITIAAIIGDEINKVFRY